jgi:UDP-N-acetylmuramate: L-alanyl-gamma-D-glutamyl-meso-diaminopimelate ligase
VITNIEHDHADIYRDVDAILWQFHQLLRTVPGNGLIAANAADANIEKLFSQGVWTGIETFSAGGGAAVWTAAYGAVAAKSTFSVRRRGELLGEAAWSLIGTHNLENALAALIAATHAGVPPETALRGLAKFKGVKRRLERLGVFGGITVYEDFAHHPTAIAMTLRAVRSLQPQQRLVAVIEPRSNTMRMGTHRESLPLAFEGADKVFVLASRDLSWNPQESLGPLGSKLAVAWDRDDLVSALVEDLNRGDNVVLMSNGSFQGLPRALQQALKSRAARSGTM